MSQWKPGAIRMVHLIREPINRPGRCRWWSRRGPVSGSRLRGEILTKVPTQRGERYLVSVQEINRCLEATVRQPSMKIDHQWVSRTLLPQRHEGRQLSQPLRDRG